MVQKARPGLKQRSCNAPTQYWDAAIIKEFQNSIFKCFHSFCIMLLRSAVGKGAPCALASAMSGMGQVRGIATVKLELPELPYSYE